MEYEARAVGLRPTREGNLQINGVELPVDPDKLGRRFFECACGRLCRFVYLPGLKCRRCTGLEHSCRHVWRTVPGLHRIVKLRKGLARRYGCAISLEPFTAIPRKKRHCVRYARIVDEIRELELGLVNYLAGINRTLTRRLELRT
jgi:hypothetical protein